MLQYDERAAGVRRAVPQDWARLIRKLRRMGLTEEARRLEDAVSTIVPAEHRFEPSDAD